MPELRAAAETRGGLHLKRALAAASAGTPLSDADLRETFLITSNPRSAEVAHAMYMTTGPQIGAEFTVRGYYDHSVGSAAFLESGGRDWHFVALVDDESGKLLGGMLSPSWPPEVSLRKATEDDRGALEEINRSSPIRMGDRQVVYEPDDIFAAERLMGTSNAFIAEIDGEPVAFAASAGHPARVDGRDVVVDYEHRVRVAPRARGGGVRGAVLWATVFSMVPGTVAFSGMIHRSNAAMLRQYPASLVAPVEPVRLAFNVDEHDAGDTPAYRAARPDDAGRIAELLNRTHAVEQLFPPYTIESLEERLSRDRTLYSWEQLRLSDRAVIGIWSNAYRVLRTDPDGSSEGRRALVLDYGFDEGAEEEFVALLRAVCRELSNLGDTELTLFTSPGAQGYETLRPLASEADEYAMVAAGVILASLEAGPVYIDQLYF